MTPPILSQLGPQDIRMGAICSGHVGVAQYHGSGSNINVTSSDTVNFTDAYVNAIFHGSDFTQVWLFSQFFVKHSAAPAAASFRLFSGAKNDGAGFYEQQADGIYIASSSVWTPVFMQTQFFPGGRPYLVNGGCFSYGLSYKPDTAGTLTIMGGSHRAGISFYTMEMGFSNADDLPCS